MTIPTIHLNGTPKATLVANLMEAIEAIHVAGKALAKTYPNGRDYYPQGPAAINQAMDEHAERMGRLTLTVSELETIVMEIV